MTAERAGLRLKPALSEEPATATHRCWGATAGLLFWHSEGETLLRPCPGIAMMVDISGSEAM